MREKLLKTLRVQARDEARAGLAGPAFYRRSFYNARGRTT
jgi:hypothetical protein